LRDVPLDNRPFTASLLGLQNQRLRATCGHVVENDKEGDEVEGRKPPPNIE